jgi:hypothetical protein
MKKLFRTTKLLSTSILAISLFACGGKNEYSIKPSSTAIKGDVSECFEVVEGTYKLEKQVGEYGADCFKLKIQVKRTDKPFDFTINDNGGAGSTNLILYCDLLEDNGTPFISGTIDGLDAEGYAQTQMDLLKLKSGETGWTEFTYGITKNNTKSDFEKAKSFSIKSRVDHKGDNSTPASSTTTTSESASSTTASVDCDKFIKDYTAFVDSYIKLLKKYKANPTDPTILGEYTDAAQKATEMESNAATCTDARYASKLMELSSKLSQAAADLAK